jgi:hypothetical protein
MKARSATLKTTATSIILSTVAPRTAAPGLLDVVLAGEPLVVVDVNDVRVADTAGGAMLLY